MSFGLKRTIMNQVNRIKTQGYKGRRLANCAVNSLLIHIHCGECTHSFPDKDGLFPICVETDLKELVR